MRPSDRIMAQNKLNEEKKNANYWNKKLLKIMVDADLKRWNDFLNGKVFPWDAPLYPDESNLITRLSNREKN